MGPQRADRQRDGVGESDGPLDCAYGDAWHDGDLAGRRAVVTGASSAIGKAVVDRLLTADVEVTVVDRDAERLAAEYGDACTRVAGTLAGKGDGRRLAARVLRANGPVELIVHNHETTAGLDILDLDEQGFHDAFDPREPFFFVRELVAALRAGADADRPAASGRVVFIAPAYTDPLDAGVAIMRARQACRGLTEVTARLWRLGVRANMIDPGWVCDPAAPVPRLWSDSPGTPDDVARLAMCLLSEDCTRLVTGRVVGPEQWRRRLVPLG